MNDNSPSKEPLQRLLTTQAKSCVNTHAAMTRGTKPIPLKLLLRRALSAVLPRAAMKLFDAYRPEKHYMRGPGPKSMSLIGERFREESESITQEPVPEHWLALMQSLERHEAGRSEPAQEKSVSPERRRS